MGSSASELTLDRGRSHGGWRFLSGFKSSGFPSKWTGRHVSSMSSQARMRCLVSRLSFLISQVFLRMRTVTKVKFRPLIHRLSSSVLPPSGEHTPTTCCWSSWRRKDCVGRWQNLCSAMNACHWFWSRESGWSWGKWRFRKVWYEEGRDDVMQGWGWRLFWSPCCSVGADRWRRNRRTQRATAAWIQPETQGCEGDQGLVTQGQRHRAVSYTGTETQGC